MAIRRWTRRHFLRATGLAGVAPLAIPRLAVGAEDWSGDFARALEANPVLLGWRGVDADRLQCTARIEGRLPDELRGTFYRNGPSVHERFGLRYHHLFDGDGMVQAFRFDGRGVTHRARVLATPKLVRETEAGRRLFSGFATQVDGGAPVRRADDVNTANISVLDHHGELLALWEGGSASVLVRATLEWRRFKVWGKGLEGLPFTAHPRVEADGTLWAFGYTFAPAPALVLYHIAADGAVVKAQALDPGPLGIVHDFVVTARHLVIVIPPLVFEPSRAEGMLLDAFVWQPELGSRVLVVDKDDFNARRWYQLPAGFGFHHGNGWEDASGTIRYDHCVAADATLMIETMRNIMRGELTRQVPEHYARFTLHPDGARRGGGFRRGSGVPPHRARGHGAAQSLRLHPRRVIAGAQWMAPAPGGQARPRVCHLRVVRLRTRGHRRGARLRAEASPAKRGRRLARGRVPRLHARVDRRRRLRCQASRRRPCGTRVARLSAAACVPRPVHTGMRAPSSGRRALRRCVSARQLLRQLAHPDKW